MPNIFDYNPQNIHPFPYWKWNKVLPAVYDDSLSQYEILCKLLDVVNNIISSTNSTGEQVEQLTQLVQQLIDGEFPSGIVQYVTDIAEAAIADDIDAINSAIETLQSQVEQSIIVASTSDFSSVNLKAGMSVYAEGYYSAGDGGCGVWAFTSDTANGINILPIANGYVKLVDGAVVNGAAYGCIGSAQNINNRIIAAINSAKAHNRKLIFPCDITVSSTINCTGITVEFNNITYTQNTGYAVMYTNGGNQRNISFRNISSDGGGIIFEQTGATSIVHVDCNFKTINAENGVGIYLHSTTHGIMECSFNGDCIVSYGDAIKVVCDDGIDINTLPFFGQNIIDIKRLTSQTGYGINFVAGATWSTITGVIINEVSFENGYGGVRIYGGTGTRAQIKGIHFNNIRTFETVTSYFINFESGNIWACDFNVDTPITIDKINVNKNNLVNTTFIPSVITGGIMSASSFIMAERMLIINNDYFLKTNKQYSLRSNGVWTFLGGASTENRIVTDFFNDYGTALEVHASYLSPFGVDSIIVNANPANSSNIKVYDHDDVLVFDSSTTGATERTVWRITEYSQIGSTLHPVVSVVETLDAVRTQL